MTHEDHAKVLFFMVKDAHSLGLNQWQVEAIKVGAAALRQQAHKTCATCVYAIHVERRDGLFCHNTTEVFGEGTVAPTFDRRVPNDYSCSLWVEAT